MTRRRQSGISISEQNSTTSSRLSRRALNSKGKRLSRSLRISIHWVASRRRRWHYRKGARCTPDAEGIDVGTDRRCLPGFPAEVGE